MAKQEFSLQQRADALRELGLNDEELIKSYATVIGETLSIAETLANEGLPWSNERSKEAEKRYALQAKVGDLIDRESKHVTAAVEGKILAKLLGIGR